ncbi:MAG: Fe-S-containing protein [Gracilibacteraceae bacterium]|jgi:uncharacterized membrane protein|nr:Fe-S-containing protein [Gracilibacteraceae bacterium]
MLKYLILVTQNSLNTFIPLALVAALLWRNRAGTWKKWLLPACGVGVFLALVLAALRRTTNLINREYWNIGLLSLSIAAIVVYTAAVWRLGDEAAADTGRRTQKIYHAAAAALCGSLLCYSLTDIFLYPTEFVLVGESMFSTDFLFKSIGYAAGLLLVLLTAWALFRAGSYLNTVWSGLSRVLLTAVLAVTLVGQAAALLQILYARRLIPSSRTLTRVLIQVVNYHDFFLYAVMALTLIIPLVVWRASLRLPTVFANPAEKRKDRAAARGRIRWSAVLILGYALTVLCLTAVRTYDEREVVLSPVEPMQIIGAEIIIPAENVSDGLLHRFLYTASDGTGVRFIVIKKNESSYGVGLDACDICGPTGYYQREDEVVCKLCDVVMNISTIGFKGGCNPVPLAYVLRQGDMVIQTEDLEAEKSRFK